MTDIFHLNLRQMSSKNAFRNEVFYYVMEKIGNFRKFDVAGFTEFKSEDPGEFYFNSGRFIANSDPSSVRSIFVGQTASGLKEYITIVWRKSYFAAGEVPVIGTTLCYDGPFRRKIWKTFKKDVPAGLLDVDSYVPPARGLSDYRGIAFVAGRNQAGDWMIFGFMHNTLTNIDPGIPFGMIPNIVKSIRASVLPGGANAQVVIGGDFNVRANPYDTLPGFKKVYATQDNEVPTRTTGSQAIDYWLCSNIPQVPTPIVLTEPMAFDLSDHCGIALKF